MISLKNKVSESFQIVYQNEAYEVHVTYKKMTNIIYRLDDHTVRVSAPKHLNKEEVRQRLEKHFPKIYQKLSIKQQPMSEDYVFLFGSKTNITTPIPENKLKTLLMDYVKKRVDHYRKWMQIPINYQVRIKTMKTRFGSNSRKTSTLHFATKLVHFAPEIIDSVIIHELVHYYHFDHQTGFYETLLRYCPNYWTYHRRLRRGEYTL